MEGDKNMAEKPLQTYLSLKGGGYYAQNQPLLKY
jgi:hypothetical protein